MSGPPFGAVADTHALVWLLNGDPKLSPGAKSAFEAAAAEGKLVGVSAITLVEIAYLEEKDRLVPGTFRRLLEELVAPDSLLAEIPLDSRIAATLRQVSRTEVPDLPDRVIAATALAAGVPLISRDSKIRLSTVATIW